MREDEKEARLTVKEVWRGESIEDWDLSDSIRSVLTAVFKSKPARVTRVLTTVRTIGEQHETVKH